MWGYISDDSFRLRRRLQQRYKFLKLDVHGFECADGWLPLIEEMCIKLDAIVKRDHIRFSIHRIREKDGRLGFFHNGTDAVYEIIDEARTKASQTCEQCGQPGELRYKAGWYWTECDTCLMIRYLDESLKYPK